MRCEDVLERNSTLWRTGSGPDSPSTLLPSQSEWEEDSFDGDTADYLRRPRTGKPPGRLRFGFYVHRPPRMGVLTSYKTPRENGIGNFFLRCMRASDSLRGLSSTSRDWQHHVPSESAPPLHAHTRCSRCDLDGRTTSAESEGTLPCVRGAWCVWHGQ